MKVQTNQGARELTAEMVCRGMVIEDGDEQEFTLLEHVGGCDDTWETNHGLVPEGMLLCGRLLGCNPVIATRADCERFGVHGDAAAHGFARLRGGGAVDLDRENFPGIVTEDGIGQRRVLDGVQPVPRDERFIGLDVRYARPEDMVRLCCDDRRTTVRLGESAILHPECCTLAIGDHDTHEDLATGARWKAETACGSCGCRGACPWCAEQKVDVDAVRCDVCGCAWCGPMRCEDRHKIGALMFRCVLPKGHTCEPHKDAAGETWETPGFAHPKHHKQMAAAVQEHLGARAKVKPTADGFTITATWSGVAGLGAESAHPKIGWYSEQTAAVNGTTFWRTPDGRTVEVTTVTDGEEHQIGWPDVRRVGPVTEFVRLGRPKPDGMFAPPFNGTPSPEPLVKALRDQPAFSHLAERDESGVLGAIRFILNLIRLEGLGERAQGGLLAARDAAVSQAIADVPDGCDPSGWTRVVHVLGAYHEETVRTRGRAQATVDMARHIEAARPVVTAYARLRFVAGYGVKEALARVPTPTDTVERICAAYEAGR